MCAWRFPSNIFPPALAESILLEKEDESSIPPEEGCACMRAQQFETSADHRISVATRQREITSWWLAGARMVKLEAVGLLAMRQGGNIYRVRI